MLRTGIETIICLSPNFLYVYVYVEICKLSPFRSAPQIRSAPCFVLSLNYITLLHCMFVFVYML